MWDARTLETQRVGLTTLRAAMRRLHCRTAELGAELAVAAPLFLTTFRRTLCMREQVGSFVLKAQSSEFSPSQNL
jgi:hypothetical protein